MTTQEIIEVLLQERGKEEIKLYDDAIDEVAQLISGSFVFPLYGALWQNFFDMDAISEHIKEMYDNNNHLALIYFVILLADVADYALPNEYFIMIVHEINVPALSSAIVADWMEYHKNSEVEEIES